jgi:enediyne biosynthesis protein E4
LKGADEFDKYQLLRDSGYHHQNMRNMLQMNTGEGPDGLPVFSEIGQLAGVSNTDWSWAPLFADFDNDGYKDLFISNGYLRDFTNLDFLKFDYVQAVNASQKEGKKIKEFEAIQQLSSTKIRNYLFRNNGNLTFENKSEAWGLEEKSISNGAVYADLDNDGDLEIIVNNINEKAFIYKNNSESLLKNNFIKVKLEGPEKNPQAIGAKVSIEIDRYKQVQEAIYYPWLSISCVPDSEFRNWRL